MSNTEQKVTELTKALEHMVKEVESYATNNDLFGQTRAHLYQVARVGKEALENFLKPEELPVRQYYYRNMKCTAGNADASGCICWYDEGTGPAAIKDQHFIKHWRDKPVVQKTSRGTCEHDFIVGWCHICGVYKEETPECGCRTCIKDRKETINGLPKECCTMIVCKKCGNKRCPKAEDHKFKCTGSNRTEQLGELEEEYKVEQERGIFDLTEIKGKIAGAKTDHWRWCQVISLASRIEDEFDYLRKEVKTLNEKLKSK